MTQCILGILKSVFILKVELGWGGNSGEHTSWKKVNRHKTQYVFGK